MNSRSVPLFALFFASSLTFVYASCELLDPAKDKSRETNAKACFPKPSVSQECKKNPCFVFIKQVPHVNTSDEFEKNKISNFKLFDCHKPSFPHSKKTRTTFDIFEKLSEPPINKTFKCLLGGPTNECLFNNLIDC